MSTRESACQVLRARYRSLPTSIGAALPGAVLMLLMWGVSFRRIDYSALVEEQYRLWQVLGKGNLTESPIDSLLSLHTQPPGLNALLAVDLALTPDRHLVLAILYLVMLLIAILGTVDTLVVVGSSKLQATVAGVLFAVLPAPVVYALWPFSTTPTMVAGILSIWGIARMPRQPVLGVAVSSLGVLTLFLFRSSFVWLFVAIWLILLAVICFRSASSRRILSMQAAVLLLTLLLTGLVQAHYLHSFGSLTLSSWGGQNVLRALVKSGALSIEPDLERELRTDACVSSILDMLLEDGRPFGTTVRESPGCQDVPTMTSRGTPAWDDPLKDGDVRNFNWSRELAISKVYERVAREVVSGAPTQLLKVAFFPENGPDESGLAIYLGPSDDYSFVRPVREQHPMSIPGGVLALFFAPAIVVAGSLGLIRAVRNRATFPSLATTYVMVAVLLLFHVLVSTMLEYGENMRFQAEMFPVLIVFGFAGLQLCTGPSGDSA